MPKYCSECGTEIPEGSKFCPSCGYALGVSGRAGNQQTSAPMMGVKPKDPESKMMIAIKVIGATLAFLFVIGLLIGGVEEDNPSSTPVIATPPISTSAPITILDETTTVYSDEYLSYSNRLDGGTTITIGVWTDGTPVDLFLMNAQDFDEYESVQQTWEAETFSYYVAGSALHVVSKTYTWVVPKSNTYYIVVDNTDAPDYGSYAGRAVNVHVVISE